MRKTIKGVEYELNDDEFQDVEIETYHPLVFRRGLVELDTEVDNVVNILQGLGVSSHWEYIDLFSSHGGYVPNRVRLAHPDLDVYVCSSAKGVMNAVNYMPNRKEGVRRILRIEYGVSSDGVSDYFLEAEVIVSSRDVLKTLQNAVLIDLSYNRCVAIRRDLATEKLLKAVKQTRLLNICIMVKNAGQGFQEVLEANAPWADYFTFLDTGSTDGTLEVIRDFLATHPGELHEKTFVPFNFRDSRNHLLSIAEKLNYAYLLILDDTYVLRGDIPKFRQMIQLFQASDTMESYSMSVRSYDTVYGSVRLLPSWRKLRYKYTIHETIDSDVSGKLPDIGVFIDDPPSPYMKNRTTERKKMDIDLLHAEIAESPNDPRLYYYLAETYLCIQDWEKAVMYYEKRCDMNGYGEEHWDAYFKRAFLYDFHLGRPWEVCEQAYNDCYRLDEGRYDPLFLLGLHYHNAKDRRLAYTYFRRAYEVGLQKEYQMNVKIEQFKHHLPYYLSLYCFENAEYELGEELCRAVKEYRENNHMIPEMKKISEGIDLHLRFYQEINHNKRWRLSSRKTTTATVSEKEHIVFHVEGGWEPWDGTTLRTKGIGGSETTVIRYAETLVEQGFNVTIFCRCERETTVNGVLYEPLHDFNKYISLNHVDLCVVNRYTECVGVPLVNRVKTVLLLHDFFREGETIRNHSLLCAVQCPTEYHAQVARKTFPDVANKVSTFSYGLDASLYACESKPFVTSTSYPIRLIYSSFPTRGLLTLLHLFPRVKKEYPLAELHVYCNLTHYWCESVAGSVMLEIRRLIACTPGVVSHGWVNREELTQAWKDATVWLYPTHFEETCCLTAWEASASDTLIVTTALAGLLESVADRGELVRCGAGQLQDREAQTEFVERLFALLRSRERQEYLRDKARKWVRGKTYLRAVSDWMKSVE